MVLSLCNLPPKNISPSLIIEKNIKQIPLEEYFAEYVTMLLKTVRIIKNKKNLRNCHNQAGLKRQDD